MRLLYECSLVPSRNSPNKTPPTPVLPGSSASMVRGPVPQVSLKSGRQPVVVSAKGLNQGFVVGAEALQRH